MTEVLAINKHTKHSQKYIKYGGGVSFTCGENLGDYPQT